MRFYALFSRTNLTLRLSDEIIVYLQLKGFIPISIFSHALCLGYILKLASYL